VGLSAYPMGHDDPGEGESRLQQLAQEIVGLGLSVVLDVGFAAKIEHDLFRSVLVGVGLELHFLEVPVDELWRRIEARNSKPPADRSPIRRAQLDDWAALSRRPMLPSLRRRRRMVTRPNWRYVNRRSH